MLFRFQQVCQRCESRRQMPGAIAFLVIALSAVFQTQEKNMATSFVSRMNRIQESRSGITNDSVPEAFATLAREGQIKRAYIVEDSTDAEGLRTLVFRQPTGRWVFQQSKGSTVLHRFEGDSEKEMYERVNEYADEENRAHDPTVLLAKAWLNTSRLGKIFASIECDSAWQLLEDELNRLKLDVTIETLDRAFANLYDQEPCSFAALIFRRDNPLPAATATAETSVEVSSSEPNRQDLRTMDIKELRRRAIFGTKGGRVASTGTVIR